MPQLDSTTFFSQIFFTCFIFIFFYINIVRWVLPALHSFFKIRNKKLIFNTITFNNSNILLNLILFSKNESFNNSFDMKKTRLINHSNSIILSNCLKNKNTNDF